MSSKKEVNPFNIAFLDLMSSALAAVIILFVIVPKSDIQIDIAESAFSDMKSGFEEVDSIIKSWAEIMSEEEIAFLLSKTDQLRAQMLEAQESARLTMERLDETRRQNEQLTTRLSLAEKRIAQIEKEQRSRATPTPAQSPKTESPVASRQQPTATPSTPVPSETSKQEQKQFDTEGSGDFFFGLEAPLVTMISWEDNKYDITLHLKDERGILLDYYSRKTSFGQWVKVPRKWQTSPNQAIIQPELVPGTYEVHAHMRKPRRGESVKISGFAAIKPENAPAKKIDFGEIEVKPGAPPHKSGSETKIGTLVVTEQNISWSRN